MAKLKDIAEASGVSIRTVSRVLNGEKHIVPEKRRRVEEAVARLGYVPNLMARALKSQKADLFGVLAAGLTLEVDTKKLVALQNAVHVAGYRTMLGFSTGDAEREQCFAQEFAQCCDGLFFLRPPRNDTLKWLRGRNRPFVVVDAQNPDDGVVIDRAAGVQDAILTCAEYYQHLVLLHGTAHSGDARQVGFERAVNQCPNHHHVIVQMEKNEFEGGYLYGSTAEPEMRTLYLCYNDRMAAGLLKGFMERNFAIPEHVGIIGF